MKKSAISLYSFLLILFLLLFSCTSMSASRSKIVFNQEQNFITTGRTYEKEVTFQYPVADILPIQYKFEASPYAPTQKSDTEEYAKIINSAVDLMRSKKYAEASEILKKASGTYKDNGLALHNLAICKYSMGDLEQALKHLTWAYAAGSRSSYDVIDQINFEIGFGHLEKKKYELAISYFKNCPAITEVSGNVVFAYIELAKTLPYPKNIMMLLYAGNYVIDNQVSEEQVLGLGSELAKVYSTKPAPELLENTILVLDYIATAKNSPHVRGDMAMILLQAGDLKGAEQAFTAALRSGNADKDFVIFAQGKLLELREAVYTYTKEVPFNVKVASGDLKNQQASGTFTVPDSNLTQAVQKLTVTVNGKPAAFETIKDRYGAAFIKINFTGLLVSGENKVVISTKIVRQPQRVMPAEISRMRISEYNRRTAEYKMFTESSDIYNLNNPLVRQARDEIRAGLRGDGVADTVKAVYLYVINKMKYELYDQESRTKAEIISRLGQKGYTGVCEDYAVFVVAILRSLGIPAFVEAGPCFGSEIGHAWPAFFTPAFDKPMVVDSTWGDAENMADYYFLFNTNLTVRDSIGWDSDVIGSGNSSAFSATSNIKLEIGKEKVRIFL